MRVLTGCGQRLVVALAALVAFPATPAQLPTPGVTDTAVLPVRIEIVRACTVSASDLNFGAYPSNSTTPVHGQTAITLNCGADTTVEVSLDAGTGLGGSTERRQLRQDSGIDRLDYGLYQDPGRRIHWGDRSGVDTLEVHTTGFPQTVPVYGEIPAGQRVRDGTYGDTITVSVHF